MKKILTKEILIDQDFEEYLTLGGQNIVLKPGDKISKENIDFLKSWKISFLQLVSKKDMEGLVFEIDFDEKFNLEKKKYFELIDKAIKSLKNFYNEISRRGKSNIDFLKLLAVECILLLKKNKEFVCIAMLMYLPKTSQMESDSFKMAVYSLIIAMQFKMENKNLVTLFECAILSNIGMIKINPLLNKYSELSLQEKQLIQTHPSIAYNIILNGMNLSKQHSLVALTHQENVDGSGYPMKLTGDKIPLYSKIITVAKRYVALSVEKTYRKRKSLHDSMHALISEHQNKIDGDVLNFLLASLSLYPIGSVVLLNSGEIGISISSNASMLMSPKVLLLADAQKDTLDVKKEVDLSLEKDLFIQEVIFDEDNESLIYSYL